MQREIMRNEVFLRIPGQAAGPDDAQVGTDLLDTLAANSDSCVGLAANMIGVAKRVICFDDNGTPRLMYNPEVVTCAGPYQTKESCLSLEGSRETTRYRQITVNYLDEDFEAQVETFTGWTAQIIQHEIDHTRGIII